MTLKLKQKLKPKRNSKLKKNEIFTKVSLATWLLSTAILFTRIVYADTPNTGKSAKGAPLIITDKNVVAIVNDQKVTRQELYNLLIDTYGEDALDVLIRRTLICQTAKKEGVVVTKSEVDEKMMIAAFDELIEEADIVIGKNSDRFDNKHINAHRMWNDLPGKPYWTKHTDDLEKQMRKHFDLPSQSLDYISEQLGFGGKDKMSFEDWVACGQFRLLELIDKKGANNLPLCRTLFGIDDVKVFKLGIVAIKKMIKYNKKDVRDTGRLWKHLEQHFAPKHNTAVIMDVNGIACRACGSRNVAPNGSKVSGGIRYKYFACRDCNQSAGRHPYDQVKTKKLS